MNSLYFGGRPVRWFGVGAPADDVASGIKALQDAVAQFGGPGRADPGGAVASLQAAGQAAVKTLGPAIDALSGSAGNVMNLTQLAYQQNGGLASLDSGPTGTQSGVDAAAAIVNQMIACYKQAANLATSPTPGVTPALPPKAVTSISKVLATTSSRGGSSTPAAPAVPPASDTTSSFSDWIAANKTAVTIGGAVIAGGVLLGAVAVAARRRAT